MSSGKVLLGLLAGVAAGTLVGVLFAPEKGSVTRKKVAKKRKDFTDGLKDKFDELLDSISEKYEKMTDEVSDFAEKAKPKEKATEKAEV